MTISEWVVIALMIWSASVLILRSSRYLRGLGRSRRLFQALRFANG